MRTSTLVMMAATALPVWGQNAVPAAVPAPDAAMLLTLPAAVDMSVEQRAAALTAASLLPADTDSFIALANLGKLIEKAGTQNDPQLAMLKYLDGVALGISAEGVQVLQELLPLFQKASVSSDLTQIATDWAADAEENVVPVIQAQLAEKQAECDAALQAALEKLRVAPVYLAITVKPEAAGMLQMMSGLGMAQLAQGAPGGLVMQNGMQGVRLPLNLPMAGQTKEVSAYLMTKLTGDSGNQLVAVLCADPAQAVVPDSPAESVLARADLQDARINETTLAVASLSPAMDNTTDAASMVSIEQVASLVSGVFRQLASSSPAFGRPGVAAADGVEFLVSQLKSLAPAADSPSQLYVWMDEDVHVEIVQDADGMTFGPATMKHPTLLTNPDVAFCMEFAPVQGGAAIDLPGALGAAEAVATGWAQTLRAPAREEISRDLDRCLSYRGDVDAADRAVRTISGSLCGSNTLVVMVPSGSQEVNAAYYSPVSNRAALVDGWNQLVQVAEQVKSKSSCKDTCAAPEVTCTQVGDASVYTLAVPADCKCPVAPKTPGALVSDSTLVLGTSAELNAALAASATGVMPLPGCVMQVRMEPTARIFDRFAAAAASCGDEVKAGDMREAADMFRRADSVMERITAGSVIVNDRLYTRVDAILRK